MKRQTYQTFDEVRAKADRGLALNLREIAIVSGYGYCQVRAWKLPLLTGKITWSDFTIWRAARLALQSTQPPAAPVSDPACVDQLPRPATIFHQRPRRGGGGSMLGKLIR